MLGNVLSQTLIEKLPGAGKAYRTVAALVFRDRLVDVHPCLSVYLFKTAVLFRQVALEAISGMA